jgi:hypothetical protein
MDWFERLTGFREDDYESTRQRLEVADGHLQSHVNGRRYGIGQLELVSLQDLRAEATSSPTPGHLRFGTVTGDVRRLHRTPGHAGALFQVASQFNLLEMTSPDITPEHGVTRYQHDRTQGPACAIAAGAATIYRNYFAPVGDGSGEKMIGQTARRQLDGLAEIGLALTEATGVAVHRLWSMRNGYALCSREGLATIAAWLRDASAEERDTLRAQLRIGLHRDVEVTDIGDGGDSGAGPDRGPLVSQAFCSALPVAYSPVAAAVWQPFAELVLEAAYEATLWAGVLNARRGTSNIVLLTRLGGGAFGNDDAWIDRALQRALDLAKDCDLDVRMVQYG